MNTPDMSDDGGPAFPVSEEEARGRVAGVYGGMSCRALFAALLMPRAVDCICEKSPDGYPLDLAAVSAVAGADALLRALAEPRPQPEPKFPEFNAYAATEMQQQALIELHEAPSFWKLPEPIRVYVTNAVDSIARRKAGEDDIPF